MQKLEAAAGTASGISLPRIGPSQCVVVGGAGLLVHSEGAFPPACSISVCCRAA